jgi:hypothetical protein
MVSSDDGLLSNAEDSMSIDFDPEPPIGKEVN